MRGTAFTCATAERLPNGACPLQSGEDVLSLYKQNATELDGDYTRHFWVLALVTGGYCLAAFLILWWRTK